MTALSISAIAAFALASAAVGLRLLLLSRTTGALPERLAAVALLGIGPLGFGLTVLSTVIGASAPWLADALWAAASAALGVGTAATAWFTCSVFHPGDARSRTAAASMTGLLAALWLYEGAVAQFDAIAPATVATRIADFVRSGAMLWGAWESLRYFALLRRRLALGLADPVVTRRFLLWGVALGAGGLSNTIDACTKLFVVAALDHPWLSIGNSACGLVAAGCLVVAFRRTPSREATPAAAAQQG